MATAACPLAPGHIGHSPARRARTVATAGIRDDANDVMAVVTQHLDAVIATELQDFEATLRRNVAASGPPRLIMTRGRSTA